MKRIIFVLLSVIIIMCGCNSDKFDDHFPVDLSYESVRTLSHFKCYAVYGEEKITLEDGQAKALFKVVMDADVESEDSFPAGDGTCIHLTFYNSELNYPSDEIREFYGSYALYPDGLMVWSGSPYMSYAAKYKCETDLYNKVLEAIAS